MTIELHCTRKHLGVAGKSPRAGEQGSYLVFVALIIVVLVGMAGLAIDSARYSTAQSEKVYTADHAATGALETYLEFEPAGGPVSEAARHDAKVQAALARVATIGGANVSSFSSDGSGNAKHIRNQADIATDDTGLRATVKFGRWWVERPTNCAGTPNSQIATCPCSGAAFGPCFQECDPVAGCVNPDNSTTKPFASAVSVTLRTDASSGVLATLSRLIGGTSVQVSGTSVAAQGSVAAALPKYGVILFDLSRGISVDNYRPFENTAVASAGEAGYLLTSSPGACSFSGASPAGGFIANLANPTAPNATLNTSLSTVYSSSTVHPASSYGCAQVNRSSGTEYYAVNKSGGTLSLSTALGDFHVDDPQPYTGLLTGLNAFLREFQTNASPADKISLIGFDSEIYPQRIYPSAATPFVSNSDPTNFDPLITMTDSREAAANAGLFPRATAKSSGGAVIPNYADLPGALQYAYNQLNKISVSGIDRYVMVFSNGLTMRESFANPTAPTTGRYILPSDLAGNKALLQQRNASSLMESVTLLGEGLLQPNRVRVHVVGAGAATGAHSLMIRKGDGKCYSDYELRGLSLLSAAASNVSPDPSIKQFEQLGSLNPLDGPYLKPFAELQNLARITYGDWTSILRTCPSVTKAQIDTACAGGAITPVGATALQKTISAASTTLAPVANEIDAQGRLLCSPIVGGLTAKANAIKTMRDTMTEMLDKRPIILVAPLN